MSKVAKVGRRQEFWDEVNDCLGMFEEGRRIVVFEDMNGRVGNSELAGVVGKWGGRASE